MQIGSCWFDASQQELRNQASNQDWKMAPYESEVLSQLVQHRGQVVSNQALQIAIEQHGETEASLLAIIQKIRSFLGKEHDSLIETVSDQGFLLHRKTSSNQQSLLDRPKRMIPYGRYFAISALTLAIVALMYNAIGHADFFQPHFQHEVVTQQGKRVVLHWYATDEQEAQLQEQVNGVAKVLQSCRIVPWTSILLAMSHDQHIASVLLKSEMKESEHYKNIKVMLDEPGLSFFNKEWAEEVGACE
ncbi:winged helix-turn-helix domain-containing protein [Shewanella gelidii]|uniref:CadC family transcriptional regulator n=1 Tax=Shewanella gelidii TaxID=1642821 RepID=A0A917JYA3_9GAMM|nr:winged helix-turn-helix domain-containing protein [Shewanella gelidii]MCL1099316.1 winged helix-turn-helix domain-containing protein [Shewanella gelidii]GGI91953.1 CadC family transcriptional regulator [Shewanella gelidii]